MAASYPAVDQRSGLHGGSKIDSAVRPRSIAVKDFRSVNMAVSDSEIRRKVLVFVVHSPGEPLNMNRLGWLVPVLCMPTECIPRCTLLSKTDRGWNMSQNGHMMTYMKIWVGELGDLGSV